MTQYTILITTLAVMAGLGVGYQLGWFLDPKRTYMQVIAYTVSLTALIADMGDSADELKARLQ